MPKEHEHKYLVHQIPSQDLTNPIRIRQGYLSIEDNAVVRVRIKGDQGYLTIKGRTDGITRPEFEYPIPLSDAREMLLMQVPSHQRIEKTRYCISHGSLVVEVDVFEGRNAGLVVAEVEVDDPSTHIPPFPCDWHLEPVTDGRLNNTQLSIHPFSKWAHKPDCRILPME